MIGLVALFGLAAWTYLLLFHHGFWRADQRLPKQAEPLTTWPSVVAIVPARNEAETIAAVAAALCAQDYAGDFRVIIVDDSSSDGTADLARTAVGHRLDVLTAPPLPAGWTGKLAALNTGIATVEVADFLWFTDADIVHPPETLTHLVAKAVTDQRDLVSLMVRLRCESFWERLLIPAFIFFFQMLYPFPAANSDRSKIAAAAGGCVLLRRETLIASGGLEAIRGRIIDDCALAALIKAAGGKIWLGLADASTSLRRADTLAPLWGMVRRTAYTQLNHSPVTLFFTLLRLALVFLGPPLAAWAIMAATYAPTLKDYGRSPWEGWLLPGATLLYGAMTFDSAVAHWRQRGGQWKGRNYNPSSDPGNLSKSL